MRTLMIMLAVAVLAVTSPASRADTRMDIGATIVNGGLSGFHFALGEYYRVPEREIMVIRGRHIPDDDIPVVLFIAQRARVAPGAVVDLRLSGRSWMDISLHFGLGPEIYYVPVKGAYGPPYGNAWGYYKNKPRKQWHKIRLADDDVVNLVNLRFISEHYGRSPDEVMRMRSAGKDFVGINDEIRHGKKGKEFREQDRGESQGPWEQRGGKEKGKWKERGEGHPGKGRGRDRGD